MANDILNNAAVASGVQLVGAVTVATGGRGSATLFRNSLPADRAPASNPLSIATLATQYDTRFDDPRYYEGDTAN